MQNQLELLRKLAEIKRESVAARKELERRTEAEETEYSV